jgi:hypothetical protein
MQSELRKDKNGFDNKQCVPLCANQPSARISRRENRACEIRDEGGPQSKIAEEVPGTENQS